MLERLPQGLPMRECFSEWHFSSEIRGRGFIDISDHHFLRGEAESARYGAKSVAVPGEAAGYWEAKQKYGQWPQKLILLQNRNMVKKFSDLSEILGNPNVSWARLVAPTVKMCR